MAVVTFWNDGKEPTGKTLAIAAVATYMAIEHNYKILIVSTSHKDKTLEKCFWSENKTRRNLGLFGPNTNNIAMENGVEGLYKVIRSNRITPEAITDYSKIVFKDRLEVLLGTYGDISYYNEIKENYFDIIDLANKYYDLVFVDLDSEIGENQQNLILNSSDIVITTLSQRLTSLDRFNEYKMNNSLLNSSKALLLIGRYDKYSKYTAKNITRYLGEKNKVTTLPYNTLFFEASEEAKVSELFLRIRNVKDDDDRNYFFIQEVKRLSEKIIYKLQDLQMKM